MFSDPPSMELLLALRTSAIAILAVLTFRALPFLGYSLLARGVRAWRSLVLALGLSALAWLDTPIASAVRQALLLGGAAYCYFGLLTTGLYLVIRRSAVPATRGVRGPAKPYERLFAFAAHPLVALPLLWIVCIWLPARTAAEAKAAVLILGWEALLSGYSLFQERKTQATRLRLTDCLFFMLVNPAVSYPDSRAKLPARPFWSGSLRVGLGISAWLAQDLLRWFLPDWTRPQPLGAVPLHSLALGYMVAFLSYYLGHSGLSGMRIGMMNLCGHGVPECYRLPFLATSPQEFWRRWNIWAGTWVRRYVFFPASVSLRRRFRRAPPRACSAFTVLISFMTMGILHDSTRYAVMDVASWGPPKGAILFAGCGALLVCWVGLGLALRRSAGWLVSATQRHVPAFRLGAALLAVNSHFLVYAITLQVVARLSR